MNVSNLRLRIDSNNKKSMQKKSILAKLTVTRHIKKNVSSHDDNTF